MGALTILLTEDLDQVLKQLMNAMLDQVNMYLKDHQEHVPKLQVEVGQYGCQVMNPNVRA